MEFLRGRINRATYWLLLGVIAAVYAVLFLVTGSRSSVSELVLLIACIPRLHDIGLSGWWAGGIVIAMYVVVFGGLALVPRESLDVLEIVLVCINFLVFAALIPLGVKAGQPFANRFGEPQASGINWARLKPARKKRDAG